VRIVVGESWIYWHCLRSGWLQSAVLLIASLVFTGNLSALVQEVDLPVLRSLRRNNDWRLARPGVDEVQLDTSLAVPVALLAIVTDWQALVTLEMPLATSQTSRSDALRLRGCLCVLSDGYDVVLRPNPSDLARAIAATSLRAIFPLLAFGLGRVSVGGGV